MNNLFGHTDAPDRAAPPRAAPPRDASASPRSTPPTTAATHFVRVAVERGIDVRSAPNPASHNASSPNASSPNASSPSASSIESGYTYSADAPLQVGERVHVPLGKGNKRAAGVVIDSGGPELALGVDPRRIKPILARTGVVLPPALVDLARWMSTYYVCPLGMVMSTMMPAAVKKGVGVRLKPRVELVPAIERPALETLALSKAALAAWNACNLPDTAALLAPDVANLSLKDLAARLGLKSVAPLNKLVTAGLLRITMKRTIVSRGWDAAAATTSLSPTTADISTTDPSAEKNAALAPPHPPTPTPRRPELNPDQQHAVHGITASLNAFAVHLLFGVTGSGKTEVYLRVIEDALANDPTASAIVLVPEIALTPQTAERFVARFQHLGVAVLHSGLSSSQRAAQWALAASGAARVIVGARSAIFAPVPNLRVVIVDEEHDSSYKQDQLPRYHARDVAIKRIHAQAAATPGRGAIVVLGSATPSLESWRNATTGKYTLWRLPHRATGASMPAVQIIDMAREWLDQRKLEGTPHALPYTWRGPHSVGPTLERSIRDTLRGDGQVMLLLNRRGFANVLVCPSDHCGWRLQCDACDALLVLHKRPAPPSSSSSSSSSHAPSLAHSTHDPLAPTAGYVRCHHCLAENQTPRTCPACARPLIMLGAGTQRVEDEIIAKFGSFLKGPRTSTNTPADSSPPRRNTPHANTNADPDLAARFPGFLRLDSDTMTSARDYFDSLGRFARGEARLLLGTQMIAKGLDFPNVHLVGVLSADTALNLPDFRAAERTYQLVSQVAGRAGRGVTPGRVIVQTYAPDSPPIIFAAKHDFEAFAHDELQARQHAGLPPIARMARIVIRDERLEHAESAATHLVELLNAAQSHAPRPDAMASPALPAARAMSTPSDPRDAVRITGPFPCAIARIAGHHRFEILLLARSRAAIQSLLADLRSRGELVSDDHMAVDIDPVTLL